MSSDSFNHYPPVNDETEPQDSTDPDEAAPFEPDMLSVQYLSNCLKKGPMEQYQCAKEKAVSVCKKIEVALLESNDNDIIKNALKHLNATLIVIMGMMSNRRHHDLAEFPVRKSIDIIW